MHIVTLKRGLTSVIGSVLLQYKTFIVLAVEEKTAQFKASGESHADRLSSIRLPGPE